MVLFAGHDFQIHGSNKGYPEGVFKPQNYVSRAEAFALIATYIESINNSDTPGGKDTIEQPKEDKPAAKTEDNPPKVSLKAGIDIEGYGLRKHQME